MSLYILDGEPGSGKSYSAVADHIVPALKAGRAVITDIPLIVAELNRLTGRDCEDLLWNLRESQLGRRPFTDLSDFEADGWERPALLPSGEPMLNPETGEPLMERPLAVCDEAHEVWPATGAQKLPAEVDSFFGKHRHKGLDIVLVTQDAGYLHASIRKRVEIRYRTKRLTQLGSKMAYGVLEFSGQSKTPANKSIRRYKRSIFKCYNSFSLGGAPSQKKVRPVWLNVRMIFIVGFLLFSLAYCGTQGGPTLPGLSDGSTVAAGQGGVAPAVQAARTEATAAVGAELARLSEVRQLLEAEAAVHRAALELDLVRRSMCAHETRRVSAGSPLSDDTTTEAGCRLVPRPPPPPAHLLAGARAKVAATMVVDDRPAVLWISVERHGRTFQVRGDSLRAVGWRFHVRGPCDVYVQGPWTGVLSCDWLEIPAGA